MWFWFILLHIWTYLKRPCSQLDKQTLFKLHVFLYPVPLFNYINISKNKDFHIFRHNQTCSWPRDSFDFKLWCFFSTYRMWRPESVQSGIDVMRDECTLAKEKMRVLEGTASSCWRSWVSAHAFLSGSRGTKPSTDGWHILRAFCTLSSNVRPTAITWIRNKDIHDRSFVWEDSEGTRGSLCPSIFSPPLLHSSWHCLFRGTCPESGPGPSGGSWWQCSPDWARNRQWSSAIQRSWSLAVGCPEPA